ncbi:acetyltransferase [Bifidobacterium ramosum]|uniref:Acetyltransferase n=1 Tax=Bifidobacterium ramosum TaxID=1798158 RepID=A0A6L4X5E5_9BIFI|nr:GNAT family N-acetyltransferase [Bifidobacterium ramosum]KAB8289417.1 acetyltransferase [Bifidobacterium ramosum]NEG71114.1 GNAT family N-acetyltransferase [Bifidobacterium ramosum]
MSEIIKTERLLLRPWKTDDHAEADSLFQYASDPQVGLLCGWPPHRNVEESTRVIRDVFSVQHNWAVTVRDTAAAGVGVDEPVGCIELKPLRHIGNIGDSDDSDSTLDERYLRYVGGNALELGYWIGRPFWGKGYMPEALHVVLDYAFGTLHVDAVWGAHYTDNMQSGRVMEKCGMQVAGESKHNHFPLINEYHDETLRIITADDWSARREPIR